MPKTKPFCLMPWIHLHSGDKGIVKACCVANIPFGDINKDTVETIWNGTAINNLRAQFIDGVPDNRCGNCLNKEKAGKKSIRQETWEKYEYLNVDYDHPSPPIYFDIRFSNVCNFRCRTCWHGASSKWFQDAKALGRNVSASAIIKNISDFDAFIKKWGDLLLGAKEIYIAGGEPLVTEEHYLLLDYLLKNGAKDIHLRYNTNFSTLNFKEYRVIAFWEQFSSVEILASIDAEKRLGEYIRKELDWSTFTDNRQKISSLKNVKFKLAPTVSALNIESLIPMYENAVKNGLIEPADFYLNILERPYYYNIQCLPGSIKERISGKFSDYFKREKSYTLPQNVLESFKQCLEYMFLKDRSSQWNNFQKETKSLDVLRNEKLDEYNDYLKIQQ